ncbi:MAG: hypothetical protein AAF333_15485 [Planctomycetota bacterium]
MTHAQERKQRRQKRKKWQQRGGGGMARVGGSGASAGSGRDAMGKMSPFWQTVIGIVTLCIVVAAVVMIVWGIFFT